MPRDLYTDMARDAVLRKAYQEAQALVRPGKAKLAEEVASSLACRQDGPILLVQSDVGQYAAPFAKRCSLAIGLDNRAGAMRHLRDDLNGAVCGVVGDARQLPFRARAFESVVSILGLHLLSGQLATLEGFLRVTRDDGQLLLLTLTREIERRHPFAYFESRGAFLPEADLLELVERSGWRVCEFRIVSMVVSVPIGHVAKVFSTASSSFLYSQRADAVAEFQRHLIANSNGAEVTLPLRWALVNARKAAR